MNIRRGLMTLGVTLLITIGSFGLAVLVNYNSTIGFIILALFFALLIFIIGAYS